MFKVASHELPPLAALAAEDAASRSAEENQRSHIARFASRYLVVATMGLGTLGGVSTVMAQASEASPSASVVPECPLNYLNGPQVLCSTADTPATCVPEQSLSQLHYFTYDPVEQKAGISIVNQSENNPAETAPAHQLEIGSQDESAVMQNNNQRADAVLALGNMMGARLWREVVYPQRYPTPGKPARFDERYIVDRTVDAARACNYEVQLTLACNDTQWTVKKAVNYFKTIVEKYKDKVQTVELCNEPNLSPTWLTPLKHKTVAQTYRTLYTKGYEAVKKINPNIKVMFGNLSSARWPMKFFNDVLAACPKKVKQACKLKMDGFGYHPYEWFKDKELKTVPSLDNPTKNRNSKILGIDALPVVESEISSAYGKGKIATEDGQMPKLYLNEFALMRDGTGPLAYRNLPEDVRAKLMVKILNKVRDDPNISQLTLYQQDHASTGNWNSGFVSSNGVILRSFYAIREWTKRNKGYLAEGLNGTN